MTVNIQGLGKITASKEALNELSLVFSFAMDERIEKHRIATGKKYENASHKIYEELLKTGYYD